MSISHEDALKAVDACIKKANEFGVSVGIAICDANGDTVLTMRMSDPPDAWLPEDSLGKCLAVVRWRGATSGSMSERANGPMLTWLNNHYGGRLNYIRGGIPIRRDGKLVGAIAAGGASGFQDESIAAAGASVIGDYYEVKE